MSDGIRDGRSNQLKHDWLNLSLIVARSLNNIIGNGPDIPWPRISADLKRFRRLTIGHYMIMGRKTYETIGTLDKRISIVLTRGSAWHEISALTAGGVHEALNLVIGDNEPFVIGGGEIYKLFMPYVQTIYLTTVRQEVVGNVTFEPPDWPTICCEDCGDHTFTILKRPRA